MAYEVTRREENLRKGPWFEEEDETLTAAVAVLGEKRWDALAKASGLRRSGKSCRLRWLNYLRPNLKHGEITEEEELIIVELHKHWGNKWAKIARRLPGRTDNEIKNYWRTHLKKRSTEVQEQEEFSSATSNARQDLFVPVCDDGVTRRTSDIENSSYGNSDESSCALNELSNISFGSSPYEMGVSDWISRCLSYEQSEVKQYHDKHGRDSLGHYSSFCYPSWTFEEERDESIWDCSSSFWS